MVDTHLFQDVLLFGRPFVDLDREGEVELELLESAQFPLTETRKFPIFFSTEAQSASKDQLNSSSTAWLCVTVGFASLAIMLCCGVSKQ
jgi:pseudouridine-5'-phosphate glycosidase